MSSESKIQSYIRQEANKVQTIATTTAITLADKSHTAVFTGTQAGAITLPQATEANRGMVIKVIFAAASDTTAFKLGFASGGSTVMMGYLQTGLSAGGATKEVVSFAITANTKNLVISSDAVATAGGDKGSEYTFTYCGLNLVNVNALGYVSGSAATDPTAAASVATGI
jgi:hypothetical protein